MAPTGTNALARAIERREEVKASFPAQLEKMKSQIALVLPKHITADRIARMALTAFKTNPKLAECDIQTILGSVLVLAQMGLEIGINGQAFLVPYNTKKGMVCQPIVGWKGYNELMHRAGRAYVKTGAVYEGDVFEYSLHTGIKKHEAGDENGVHPDKIKFFYAEGYLRDFDKPVVVEVWTIKRLLVHRDKFNKVGIAHYSYENLEPYGRKVLFLQAVKYLPLSVEIQQAIRLEESEDGKRRDFDLKNASDGSWEFAFDAPVDAETTEQKQDEPPKDAAA